MSKTLPLTVSNTGFLVDRLGQDCAPLQFVRELTQNSIDAIRRAGVADGRIVWDADGAYLQRGIFKLSITDNGDGMTGDEMGTYINSLSSSGSTQSFAGNYGVGAKIAAATRNHHGLIYLSWKAGRGSMAHLWRDPESGQYGLRQLEHEGTFSHHIAVTDDVKPDVIEAHGTRVVLLGNSENENTTIAPEGYTARDRWIVRYLNTRYFRLPPNVTITARDGMERASKGGSSGYLRRIRGQAWFLEASSVAHGSVPLTGARAHWWIVKEGEELVTEGPSFETRGHVAALYQDELYEMSTARSGRALLQQFGVIFGMNRVVIYVEPSSGSAITTNTARTRLILDSCDLPWAEWAAEFRQNLPDEIRALIDEIGSKTSDDHEKAIRERLKPLLDLYRVSRYRFQSSGRVRADERETCVGGTPNERGKTLSGSSKRGARGGRAGGVYGNFVNTEGRPADPIHPDAFPRVRWVSAQANPPTREPDDIEDRAARFLAEENVLMINGDFRIFHDMVERVLVDFQHQPSARVVCEAAMRTWFEQTLVEAVIGVQALKGSKEWNSDDVKKALSEEALTTAVVPRYHVFIAIKREIALKLGKAA